MHTTNYTDTLILPSPDSTASHSTAPTRPGTVAALQHDLLIAAPYTMTSDDLLVAVTAARRAVPADEHTALRAEIFSKGQACLRASPLVKTYGWAIHHDAQSRVALVAQGSDSYARLMCDRALSKVAGIRSSRG